MSIVSDVLLTYMPGNRKQTPSGWVAFNAPCCIHNGETRDERQRGGLIQEGDTVSYHCFNCGYKTGWQPGRHISYNLRQLMIWLGVPDDIINKTALAVLRLNENIVVKERFIELPEFTTVRLPDGAVKISELSDYNENNSNFKYFVDVIEYMNKRKLNLDDTDYYWSPSLGFRDRLIIPFYYEGRIVGYTARTVKESSKAKYLTDSQPGFVFNLDEQRYNKIFCIVCEGPIDAIHVEGCALMGSEISKQQSLMLNRLQKDIILVPDRDSKGKKLAEQALELGWSLSMPDWDNNVKDIGDCVQAHGRLYTLYSIVNSAEKSQLKNKLRMKKWFG